MKHTFKDWLLATRPWSFPASAMPVLTTFAYMAWIASQNGSEIDWLSGILAIVGIILFHASGNVLSDYNDYKKSVDNKENRSYMPLVSGKFTPAEFLRLSSILAALGVAIGLYLTYRCGWGLLIAGAAGAFFTASYSTFKYHALGDLVIFLSYSVIPIMGTTFAVSGSYYYPALIFALPIGLITVAILHVNNTRDIVSDGNAGIQTFAMLIGEKVSIKLYAVEVLFPFILIAINVILGLLPWLCMICLLALPKAWSCAGTMLSASDKGIETIAPLDESTAQLQLIFSLLLTISLFIALWI